MNTLRRTLGWIGGAIMVAVYAVILLALWPFVRRTESQLKDEADDN